MKRLLFAIFAVMMCAGVASAQNYMVVNSEKVFKSIDAYNSALEQIETLSESYQKQVDAKFAAVETLYNNYMAQRASLSESVRQSREQQILNAEAEAAEYQESLFGNEGELMKKRMELIQPIQQQVFAALESFAKANGYDLVLDKASNASILYHNNSIDHTAQVIELFKK